MPIPEAEAGGILKELVIGAVAGIAGLIGWVWRNTMGRLDRLERCTVRKAEFEKLEERAMLKDDFENYVKRSDMYRQEQRETTKELHNKIDSLQSTIMRCIQIHRVPPED